MTNNFDELSKTKVQLDRNSILFNGYGLIAQEVMRNKDISVQAKAIYSYLVSFAGADGIAYPTQALMMDELGMNKSTFNKYLKEILSTGYIKVTQTRKDGKAYKNIYTIAMDKRDLDSNRKSYLKIAIKNKSKKPKTLVNNLPSQCIKICDIDEQCHKKQGIEICESKSNSFKNNNVVVESEKEKMIKDYGFKLTENQSKLLESMDIGLLKESIEITIAQDGKSFSYIHKVYKGLLTKPKSKTKSKVVPNKSNSVNKPKNKFHNTRDRAEDYTPDELMNVIEGIQNHKQNDKNITTEKEIKSIKKTDNCNSGSGIILNFLHHME